MKASMNIKIDKDTRDRARDVFRTIGIDMTTAVNMFFKATIRENGIPFPLAADPLGINAAQIEQQVSFPTIKK